MVTVTVADVAERLRSSGARVEVVGDPTTPVHGASHDSRSVTPGSVFACLRGASFDGHEYAAAAVEGGASALLVDHRLEHIDPAVVQIVVEDTRKCAGPASAVAWGDPADRLSMVGVTGTNGKTTTAQIVAALLTGAGRTPGIIGTLHGPRTTPEAPDLHAALAAFVDDGRDAVVMEVSSHALELRRVDGTRFDVVGFTNFGHDHLDLHGSPEAYFRAKARLFGPDFAPCAVVNVDDPHGRLLADSIDAMQVHEVSGSSLADVHVDAASHSYTWRGRRVEVPLGGDFNVANSHVALGLVARLDVDIDAAIGGLRSLGAVPGRFELVDTPESAARSISVVVDYAHTPDGLERVLEAARAIASGRVIAVFGCAGRRDAEKRPVMGECAARLADVAIATSDNPRGEDPVAIIDDVIAGVPEHYRSRVSTEPDRRLAIRAALARAGAGDVVVIAGKGHETSQDLGDVTIDFDDRVVAREELARLDSKDLS